MFVYFTELLWTAPELLRNENTKNKLVPEDFARGDVYSFGIICHEIVMRCEPFECGDMVAEGILHRVYQSF